MYRIKARVKLTVAAEAVAMVTNVAGAVEATDCVFTRGLFTAVVCVQSTFVCI